MSQGRLAGLCSREPGEARGAVLTRARGGSQGCCSRESGEARGAGLKRVRGGSRCSCSCEPGEARGAVLTRARGGSPGCAYTCQGTLAGLCHKSRRPSCCSAKPHGKRVPDPPTPAPADLLRALGHSPGLSTSLFSYLKWEQGPLPPQLQRGSLWKSKGQSSHGLLFSLSRSHFYLPRPSPAMLPTATTQQRGRSPRTLTLEPDVEG